MTTIVLSLIGLLTSCGFVPRIDAYTYVNVISPAQNDKVQRANFPSCGQLRDSTDVVDRCDRRLFVGVAISGGGSRAANFALGVLWQLKQLGLLQETTALSSVSGGSLAASYVALFGLDTPASFQQAATVLRQDFLTGWIWRSLSPAQAARVNFSHATATQTLAATFDDLVFHGKTFGDLGAFGPYRPYLYINAALQNTVSARSHLTTRGENTPSRDLQGFTFTSEAFEALQSQLSSYRIADAVAASGAYPGMFEPMVLRNYFNIRLQGEPPTEYLHLSDGGTADNLGVDALIRAAEEFNANALDLSPGKNACLFILVDAAVHDPARQPGALPDLRTGPSDSLISSSLFRAFDLLLDRRREDQLSALGIKEAVDNPVRFYPAVEIPLGNYSYWDAGTSKARIRGVGQWIAPANGGGKYHTAMTCAVWHVSFDHLQEITTGRSAFQRENFGPWPWVHEKPLPGREREIERLDYFVNSVATNYRLELTGKSQCSATSIQRALFDAARVLVRDDTQTLSQLADWLWANDRTDLARSVLDSELFEVPVAVAPNYSVHSLGEGAEASSWIHCD